MGMGLAGLLLSFIRRQLSVVVNFSFHTIHNFCLVQILWLPRIHLLVSSLA